MDFLNRIRTRAEKRRVGDYGRLKHAGRGVCLLQHDFDIANGTGAAVRIDFNDALEALVTLSSGTSAPATTYAHQLWADTTNNVLKRRNAANSAWLVVRSLSETFVVSRSSNTILASSDVGKTFVATATFTQTLTAAATLADGWWCAYRIEAGAVITFDPNSSENIDGAATKAVTGPASGFIYCNGSVFFTVGFTQPQGSRVLGASCRNNTGTPNTQFDLDAFEIILRNAAGDALVRIDPGAALTNNISTGGPAANGRDQAGAFSSSSWVHFYWIWNGSTLATVSSAAAPPTGPTLPSGYTHWAYATSVRIDGSGNLLRVTTRGANNFYAVDVIAPSYASLTATSETTLDLSDSVPPNALSFVLRLAVWNVTTNGSGALNAVFRVRAVTGVNYWNSSWDIQGLANSTAIQLSPGVTCEYPNLAQSVIYLWAVTTGSAQTATLNLASYRVPNGGE